MRKNRKIFLAFAALFLTAGLVAACGSNGKENQKDTGGKEAESTIKIVTTIFPEYDWVREILGSHAKEAEVTMLLDQGVDLHSYQPTVDDIAKISECDLFLYVGGESDEWVEDALKSSSGKDRETINLLEVLGDNVREEEVVEGMEVEEEEESGEEGEEPEYDEHVWLSLKNARVLCGEIEKKLEIIDKDHAEDYQKNLEQYQQKLSDLDEKYQKAVGEAKNKTLLFGDRFPFRYLTEDYGLTYYAAFVGCSAETEASFETITFLAKKVDELELKYVLTIDNSDQKIAKTIIENTKEKNQQVRGLDSLQSTTSEDVEKGKTYLKAMEDNLEVFTEVLQ